MSLEAIRYSSGSLTILNQLLLPLTTEYIPINTVEDAFEAIRSMKVRGAPAIAVVSGLSVAVELHKKEFSSTDDLVHFCEDSLKRLVESRPTAVNMRTAADQLTKFLHDILAHDGKDVSSVKQRLIAEIESMLQKDIADNKAIGRFGAEDMLRRNRRGANKLVVLTICNTGSLATAGYGTALGVIRSLHESGHLEHVYYLETRPYCQGSRLTAYEMVTDGLPATLICDSAAAYLMASKTVDCVVSGADRVAANGDTANKIGTYMLAVLCQFHNVPFYVAAPVTTCDLKTESGSKIVVEERDSSEITSIQGKQISPVGVHCWNPAFDVTPANLITGGIITEKGVFAPSELKAAIAKYK